MTKRLPSVEDLIGIEHCKLGFYQELRQKLEELQDTNKESEQRRREMVAILDGITDIMMVLSEDLCIISVNHVFREVLQIEEPEGRYCYEIFRKQEQPCPECPAHRSFLTGDVCRETSIFKIGDRNIQYEMVASPIRDPDNDERRILIFKRDVTLEKEYQAKFYQAEKMATVGMLATGVAHEINNPLASISGFAEGLQRRFGRLALAPSQEVEDIQDYVDTILKECRRCRDIVRTLLTFSRPVSSGFSPVSINAVVEDTLKLLRSHVKQAKGRVSMNARLGEDLPIIYGDEPQLKQVLLNLLINAMDALEHSAEGVITVRTCAEPGEGVALMVEDNGCGIPKDHADKLFEPFFTTKAVGKGIGIGLSTCYAIVQEHHGEILVSSELGKGSRFTVRLPANTEYDRD